MQGSFIGEVKLFAGNFAPAGWAFCEGQLLLIAQYTVLFSILGTIYGGDVEANFALPDLRRRVPIGAGALSNRAVGQRSGSENTTQLVSHTHVFSGTLKSSSEDGVTSDPTGNYLAKAVVILSHSDTKENNTYKSTTNSTMAADVASGTIANTGSGSSVNNMHSWLGIHYIIGGNILNMLGDVQLRLGVHCWFLAV